MATKFKVGDKIVCIDRPEGNSNIRKGDTGILVKNDGRTVREITNNNIDMIIKIDKKKCIYAYLDWHSHCYTLNNNIWNGEKNVQKRRRR